MSIDGKLEDLSVKNINTNYVKDETEIEYDEVITLKQIQEVIDKLRYASTIKKGVYLKILL